MILLLKLAGAFILFLIALNAAFVEAAQEGILYERRRCATFIGLASTHRAGRGVKMNRFEREHLTLDAIGVAIASGMEPEELQQKIARAANRQETGR